MSTINPNPQRRTIAGVPRRMEPGAPPVEGPVRVPDHQPLVVGRGTTARAPLADATPSSPSHVTSRPSPEQIDQMIARATALQGQPAAASPFSRMTAALDPLGTHVGDDGLPLGSEWERLDLISKFVFYEWGDLSVRQFDPLDHAKVARAVRHKNTSLILDVVASTCTRDPRDMTFNDLQGLLLWHKFNSYMSTPYNVTWTSRYGVEGKASTAKSRLEERWMKRTREDYRAMQAQGFAVPTCRDMELFNVADVDEDLIFLFDKAQWLAADPARVAELEAGGDRAARVTARLEALNRRGLKSFGEIEAFARDYSSYGVQEFATVRLSDAAFVPETALEALRQQVHWMTEGEEDRRAEIERLQAEIADIEAAVAADTRYKPLEEEVPVIFNLWGMFPYL